MRPALWTSATSAGASVARAPRVRSTMTSSTIARDLPAHQLVAGAHGIQPRVAARAPRQGSPPDSGTSSSMSSDEQPGAQAVVDVMGVVGDVVGDRRALRLEAGEAVELEIEQLVEVEDGLAAPGPLAGSACGPVSGPLCLTRPSSVSQRQVEPVELGIAPLQPGDDAQRLGVVVEAAPWPHLRRRAHPRRYGRTACGRNRGPARRPRRDPRRSAARAPARGRSAPPRSCG